MLFYFLFMLFFLFFFSSRRRHTRCALVTGVQTCALPISFDGRKADYERHYAQNHANPIKARSEAITWWHGLASAPTNEDVAINTTAQRLQDLLSENSIRRLTLPEFREVAGDVHAMIEFSRRVRNGIVGIDRKSVVKGKSVSVRVDTGGHGSMKKNRIDRTLR